MIVSCSAFVAIPSPLPVAGTSPWFLSGRRADKRLDRPAQCRDCCQRVAAFDELDGDGGKVARLIAAPLGMSHARIVVSSEIGRTPRRRYGAHGERRLERRVPLRTIRSEFARSITGEPR